MSQKIPNHSASPRVQVKGAKPLLLRAVTNPLPSAMADSRPRLTATRTALSREIYTRRPVARAAQA